MIMKQINNYKFSFLNIKFEFSKYIFVGIITVAIDITLYFIFINLFFINHEISKKISFCGGAIFSFIGNKYFTFKSNNNFKRQAIMFSILYFTTFFINTYTHDLLWVNYENEIIAVCAATIISVVVNYLGQKFIIFSK